jgi:hypothetical protein
VSSNDDNALTSGSQCQHASVKSEQPISRWKASIAGRVQTSNVLRSCKHGLVTVSVISLLSSSFCCRELLQAGFSVRAGVRDVEKAETSLQVAAQYGIISSEQLKNVQVVQFDLSAPESIAPAIGNANKVRWYQGWRKALEVSHWFCERNGSVRRMQVYGAWIHGAGVVYFICAWRVNCTLGLWLGACSELRHGGSTR